MKVIWLGQNGLLFVSGKNKVLVDPYLTDTLHELDSRMERGWNINKRFLDISPDVIILTNSHLDHLDIPTLKNYIKKNKEQRTLLCCESAFEVIADTGIVGRYNNVLFDEGYEWTHDNLHIKAVRAYSDDRTAIGVIITDTSEDKKYYITSDTLYNEKIFASLPDDIYTVFLPINGEDGCMNMYDAERFAKKVGAIHTVPVHFGMFDDVNPNKFKHDGAVVPAVYKIIPLEDDENAKRRRMSLKKVFANEEKNMKMAEQAKIAEKVEATIVAEVKTEPVKVTPIPTEVKAEPVKVTPIPTEVKTEPIKVMPIPTEVKTEPVKVTPIPTEVKTEPIKVMPIPTEMKTEPIKVTPIPTEVKATPIDVKPIPTQIKTTDDEEMSIYSEYKAKSTGKSFSDESRSYNRVREISGKRSTLWKEVAKLSDRNVVNHSEEDDSSDSKAALWERLDRLANEIYDDGLEEIPCERFIEDEETLSSKSCLWEEIARMSEAKQDESNGVETNKTKKAEQTLAEATKAYEPEKEEPKKADPVEEEPVKAEPVKTGKADEKEDFFVEIIEDDDDEIEMAQIKPQFSESDIVESDFIVEAHNDIDSSISKEDIDKELIYYDDSIADGFSDDPYDDGEDEDVSEQIDAYIKELENFERGDTVDFDRAELKK